MRRRVKGRREGRRRKGRSGKKSGEEKVGGKTSRRREDREEWEEKDHVRCNKIPGLFFCYELCTQLGKLCEGWKYLDDARCMYIIQWNLLRRSSLL